MAFVSLNHAKKNGAQLLNDMQEAAKQGQRTLTRFGRNASGTIADSAQVIKNAYITANRRLHKNPWKFISGVALGGLIVGYWIGRSKK